MRIACSTYIGLILPTVVLDILCKYAGKKKTVLLEDLLYKDCFIQECKKFTSNTTYERSHKLSSC